MYSTFFYTYLTRIICNIVNCNLSICRCISLSRFYCQIFASVSYTKHVCVCKCKLNYSISTEFSYHGIPCLIILFQLFPYYAYVRVSEYSQISTRVIIPCDVVPFPYYFVVSPPPALVPHPSQSRGNERAGSKAPRLAFKLDRLVTSLYYLCASYIPIAGHNAVYNEGGSLYLPRFHFPMKRKWFYNKNAEKTSLFTSSFCCVKP